MSEREAVEAIARKLTKGATDVLFVPGPWLLSYSHLSADEFDILLRSGLIEATYPEARPGDSGRQFWHTAELGLAVRDHLKGTDHDRAI